MVTCQSVNQLKTPAKVSWAFKMVSQFGSTGYTIMGKTADLRWSPPLRGSAKHNRLVRGASAPSRQIDRSIGTQHTKAPRERSKSIKSRLLSSRCRSTPMPRTDRSAQRRSIPNKPKQTINNGGRCVAIDVHGFANLRHPNTANPTCSLRV